MDTYKVSANNGEYISFLSTYETFTNTDCIVSHKPNLNKCSKAMKSSNMMKIAVNNKKKIGRNIHLEI